MAFKSAQIRAKAPARRGSVGTLRAGSQRRRSSVKAERIMTESHDSSSPTRRRRRSQQERELAHRMLEALKAGADLRTRKVRRLRAAIRVRAYENDLKFQVALEKMLG